MTKKLEYKDLHLHTYRNTRPVFAGLDVSDLVRAAVLAPLNLLVVGDTGSGKTQLIKGDIFNSYFGGNKREDGHGVLIRGNPEIDIYNEIFTELNMEKAQRELTRNIEALVYVADELNRAPPVAQNQFFGLGDGAMDYKGQSIHLGKNGYHLLLATANIGNGEFQGTFETDKAMYNRLHVALDLDYAAYMPTREDKFYIDMQKADPNVKDAPKQDLTDKILAASKEISAIAEEPGLEALSVINYIRFGLNNCLRNSVKDKRWPLSCQDCPHNTAGTATCSYIRDPVERTLHATRLYAGALHYLAKMKNPRQPVDTIDLMFKSFELTGAYQSLLNPLLLRTQYHESNPGFMATAAEKLKEDFRKHEDFIMGSIEEAQQGRKVTAFFEHGGHFGSYDTLSEEAQKTTPKIEPYANTREIGLGWMPDFLDFISKHYRAGGK